MQIVSCNHYYLCIQHHVYKIQIKLLLNNIINEHQSELVCFSMFNTIIDISV